LHKAAGHGRLVLLAKKKNSDKLPFKPTS
jgi:hypothetical protein